MTLIEVPCPICGATTKTLPRYPRRVCGTCVAKASDESGRALKFFFLLALPLICWPYPLFAGLTPCLLALPLVCWPCSRLLASQRRQT